MATKRELSERALKAWRTRRARKAARTRKLRERARKAVETRKRNAR